MAQKIINKLNAYIIAWINKYYIIYKHYQHYKTIMKTLTTITFFIFLNIFSYTKNDSFQSLNIQFTDSKGKLEYFPDLMVTYTCTNYERMQGLHMIPNSDNTKVTVNYGGWGRRRGFRDFNCISK